MTHTISFNFTIIGKYYITFYFIGSFLSGVFRAVIPIVRKGTIALGEELLKTGSNVVQDVWKTGDLATAKKTRGKEFINKISNRVSDHMFGSGYSNILGVRREQLKRGSQGKKKQKVTKRKAVKRKTKKGKTGKSKRKAVKKKNVKRKTKQNIQDLFT